MFGNIVNPSLKYCHPSNPFRILAGIWATMVDHNPIPLCKAKRSLVTRTSSTQRSGLLFIKCLQFWQDLNPTYAHIFRNSNTVIINDHQLVVQKCQGCVVHPWPPFASPKSLIATVQVPQFLACLWKDQFGTTTVDVGRFEVFQSSNFNQYSYGIPSGASFHL